MATKEKTQLEELKEEISDCKDCYSKTKILLEEIREMLFSQNGEHKKNGESD